MNFKRPSKERRENDINVKLQVQVQIQINFIDPFIGEIPHINQVTTHLFFPFNFRYCTCGANMLISNIHLNGLIMMCS